MIYELIFKGLKSTKSLEEGIRRRIHNLLESAPSDASASAEVKKSHKGYEGLIEIFSSQGKFVAEAVGSNMNDLVHSLTSQIQKQIKEWRGYRFQVQ
jgi:hypothetical protein